MIVSWHSHNLSARVFGIVFLVRATILMLLALRYGVGGVSKLGQVCLALGIAGIGSTLFISGIIGVSITVFADFIGFVPAFVNR